jgi:hypothetical protein
MAEYKASTVPDEITPEERQRRLGQVYGVLAENSHPLRDQPVSPNNPLG